MNNVASAPANRLPILTSLRWFGAFLVFAYHASVLFLGFNLGHLQRLMLGGATGVSFFFVLSGFVLTWSFNPAVRVTSFWRNRVARIVPLHVAVWVLAYVQLAGQGQPHRPGPMLAALFLVQSWIPSKPWFFAANLVSWSLACEMFFYLLFPVLVRVLGRVRWRLALIAVLATISIGGTVYANATWHGHWVFWLVYIFPLARLPEFLIGIVLAHEFLDRVRRGRPLPTIPLGPALVVAFAAVYAAWYVPYLDGFVPVTLIPFILVIAAGARRDLIGKRSWLRDPIMLALGEASYAFYLVHVQMGYVIGWLIPAWKKLSAARALGLWVAVFEAALLAAFVLNRAIERPGQRLLRSRARRTESPPAPSAPSPSPPPPGPPAPSPTSTPDHERPAPARTSPRRERKQPERLVSPRVAFLNSG